MWKRKITHHDKARSCPLQKTPPRYRGLLPRRTEESRGILLEHGAQNCGRGAARSGLRPLRKRPPSGAFSGSVRKVRPRFFGQKFAENAHFLPVKYDAGVGFEPVPPDRIAPG